LLLQCKSPGSNQILAELIQTVGEILGSVIYKLINSICNKEYLPDQWKESITVPVHNTGDKTDRNNYRQISLLSTSYKMISNILFHRSTTDQILEKKWEYNETVHQLFIGFKKAYDSMRKAVLYDILRVWRPH
jgi:hypothetical protein